MGYWIVGLWKDGVSRELLGMRDIVFQLLLHCCEETP